MQEQIITIILPNSHFRMELKQKRTTQNPGLTMLLSDLIIPFLMDWEGPITTKSLKNPIIYQNWKFKPLVKESFMCSGIALLFENESAFRDSIEKEFFFKD